MRELARGQRVRLADLSDSLSLEVGLAAAGAMELDIACFGVDAGGELSDDRYMIFYNQPSSPQGEIRLLGGNSTERERFAVDLGRLPAQIDKLVFTLTVADPATLADLHSGYIRWSAGGVELLRFAWRGTDFASEKAIMVAEIYRRDPWRIAAVGQGFNGGLAALVEHFGGEVGQRRRRPRSLYRSVWNRGELPTCSNRPGPWRSLWRRSTLAKLWLRWP